MRALVGVVACAFALAGCAAGASAPAPTSSSSASTPSPGERITVAGLTANYHGTADVSHATGKVVIELKNFFFEPTVLHGAPGQQITFTLQNTSENPHTFTTADMSADIEVQPGMIAEGRVTLPRSGNLSFFCRFHKEQGMAGGFNVSGPIEDPGKQASGSPAHS